MPVAVTATAASNRSSREQRTDRSRRIQGAHDALPRGTMPGAPVVVRDRGRWGRGEAQIGERMVSYRPDPAYVAPGSNDHFTLICSAPSTLVLPPIWPKNPLRRTLMINEFGRLVETLDWLPSRSSGSQSKRCIRSTPSCETRGRDGNRSACFQLRIFCRVT